MGRDKLKDVESNLELRVISFQKSLEDKKGYISPLVPLISLFKEKGLPKYILDEKHFIDGFELSSNKRTFSCQWEISEHTLFLTSFFNNYQQLLDDDFLANFEMKKADNQEDADKIKVKATWLSGVILATSGYPINDTVKNGVAYYITDGNCIKKEAILLYPNKFGTQLADYIEGELDLSEVIK
ncbi:MAG: hypothetical protein EOM50_20605 [Erysipelotrichia bacterium]|nr:hypothetical protein [Erysipelotrichia bacterium]